MVDTPDTHPFQGLTAATELLRMLCERYPATFRHESEPPQPLAIGISDHLIAELALDPATVHNALRLYVRRKSYQRALVAPGAMRVDLTGQPTEPVTPEHQAAARAPRPHQAAKTGQPDAAPMA